MKKPDMGEVVVTRFTPDDVAGYISECFHELKKQGMTDLQIIETAKRYTYAMIESFQAAGCSPEMAVYSCFTLISLMYCTDTLLKPVDDGVQKALEELLKDPENFLKEGEEHGDD